MAYFPDLSPYAYGNGSHSGVVHVGWLDNVHPFLRGKVDICFLEKMRLLAADPLELQRGSHICELCPEPDLPEATLPPNHVALDMNCPYGKWLASLKSNGEIRVTFKGVTYAAPVLIVHYIEEHHYLPPDAFLRAIKDAAC